jgi:hypothetical protein
VERNVWRTSSRTGSNGQCVEVKYDGDTIAVRDTKDRTGPVLTFSTESWAGFVAAIKDRRFDLTN